MTVFQYFWIGCAVFNTIMFVTDSRNIDRDLVYALIWSWVIPPLISVCLLSILIDNLNRKKPNNPFYLKRK